MTCCRRSSSYCRAIGLPRRAVAFQSMIRVSSPGTHSRRPSKSRPSPRAADAAEPGLAPPQRPAAAARGARCRAGWGRPSRSRAASIRLLPPGEAERARGSEGRWSRRCRSRAAAAGARAAPPPRRRGGSSRRRSRRDRPAERLGETLPHQHGQPPPGAMAPAIAHHEASADGEGGRRLALHARAPAAPARRPRPPAGARSRPASSASSRPGAAGQQSRSRRDQRQRAPRPTSQRREGTSFIGAPRSSR